MAGTRRLDLSTLPSREADFRMVIRGLISIERLKIEEILVDLSSHHKATYQTRRPDNRQARGAGNRNNRYGVRISVVHWPWAECFPLFPITPGVGGSFL